jgi:hypothetical protein
MANNSLSIALGKVLNSHFTDFLDQVSKKHSIEIDHLLNEWSEFSGLKKKKPVVTNKIDGPYGEFTVKQLKDKCKSVGIKVGGKKIDLVQRLRDFDSGKLVPKALELARQGPYEGLTVKELKDQLKEKGLKVGGKKNDLIQRLNDSDNESESESDSDEIDYASWTVAKLKEECETRGLPKSGKKSDLVGRLQIDDDSDNDDSESESESEDDSD